MKSAVCEQCDTPFEYANKGKPRRFCSHPCYAESLNGSSRGGAITLNCENCGKSFTVKRFYRNRKDGKSPQRFCSRDCATPAIAAAHVKHEPVPCLTCGEMFQPRTNKGRLSEFCSRNCFGKSYRAPQALIKKVLAEEPTSIELAMMKALDAAFIEYRFQVPVPGKNGRTRCICDFMIPDASLVIECDGDYWHSLEKMKKSDKRKTRYLKQKGYTVLRFSGTMIREDMEGCIRKVKDHLSSFLR